MFASTVIILIIIIFVMNSSKTSVKDFFLHLGMTISLYAVSVSFLNLVFRIINEAFPEVNRSYYSWGGGSEISLPVATLIVAFPLFLVLSRFVYKIYSLNPEKKELGIRKWLVYITLFVAGMLLAGDLVTVIYKFLDGQDLTSAFLLKALSVIVVAGLVFGYYLQDIRDRVSPKNRKIWAIAVSILLLAFILIGFGVLGSPSEQRKARYDNQRISDLQNIQWRVMGYWQMKGAIPANLDNLEEFDQNDTPIDPETKVRYEYRVLDPMKFELCAEFNTEDMNRSMMYGSYPYEKGAVIQNEVWNHKMGRHCFTRVIDPVAYPTQVRG